MKIGIRVQSPSKRSEQVCRYGLDMGASQGRCLYFRRTRHELTNGKWIAGRTNGYEGGFKDTKGVKRRKHPVDRLSRLRRACVAKLFC